MVWLLAQARNVDGAVIFEEAEAVVDKGIVVDGLRFNVVLAEVVSGGA